MGQREVKFVLEGELTKDEPLGWLSHYRLSGQWIRYWIIDTLPQLRAGSRVRITIEEVDERA